MMAHHVAVLSDQECWTLVWFYLGGLATPFVLFAAWFVVGLFTGQSSIEWRTNANGRITERKWP